MIYNNETNWSLETPMILKTCLTSVASMLLSLQTRLLIISLFVCVCKSHYIDCLIKELGIGNTLGNLTYIQSTLTNEEILDNHMPILCSFWISTNGTSVTLLHSQIRQVFLWTALYGWVCQMVHKTSFQIINM